MTGRFRRAAQALETAPPASGGSTRPLLEVRGLCSGYGDAQVLWDVSLFVQPGEVVSLIGANGAGKTTLLLTLSKIVAPWAGEIRFDGQDFTRSRSEAVVQAGIVQVPQGRRLFAGLSVRDNLLQGAYGRRDSAGVRSDLERVLGLFPHLKARLRQPAGLLSGGEQQACAIGRALMARPRLLLIDELSLGLGPLVVDALLGLITSLTAEGMTILLVEQDVQVALEHADRGYVLENGRIGEGRPAADLLVDPSIRRAYLGL